MNSPVRLGVSPAASPPPPGVFTQRVEALFSLQPWVVGLSCSPVVPLGLSAHECGTAWSSSCCLAESPLCPATVSALLLVWVSVSSLTLVVGFPYSSIFWQFWLLFLNCCCPSCGCARRHRVSAYASILAGSEGMIFVNCNPGTAQGRRSLS